jgi:hypothetical protein
VHTPLQAISPGLLQTHFAAIQSMSLEQTTPQPPQLSGSCVVSTQAPLHEWMRQTVELDEHDGLPSAQATMATRSPKKYRFMELRRSPRCPRGSRPLARRYRVRHVARYSCSRRRE